MFFSFYVLSSPLLRRASAIRCSCLLRHLSHPVSSSGMLLLLLLLLFRAVLIEILFFVLCPFFLDCFHLMCPGRFLVFVCEQELFRVDVIVGAGTFFYFLSFMFIFIVTLGSIALEKETRLREIMQLSGLRDAPFWISWFLQVRRETICSLVCTLSLSFFSFFFFSFIPFFLFFFVVRRRSL